jgi:hypothetical protein
MASCATCGTTIVFGGKKDGDQRFCDARCQGAATLARAAASIPDDAVREEANAIQRGPCPCCGRRNGPVDLHRTFRVHSALVVTSWSSRARISCRPCATRRRLLDTLYCAALGWWGLPWGLLMTPIQIVRNLAGLFGRDTPLGAASPALMQTVRLQLAASRPRSAA